MRQKEKLYEAVACAYRQSGWTINLNFSSSFEETLKQSDDPMRLLSKRVNQKMNEAGLKDIPMLLALEMTRPEERLHAHGIVIADEAMRDQISEALRHAVGYIHGRSGSRQLMMKPISQSQGWANYITKSFYSTRKRLGLEEQRKLWWISRPLTQETRKFHEEYLRSVPANVAGAASSRKSMP